MTNRMMLGIFIVVCVAQLLAPVSMIYTHETTLASGKMFKFKTAPVDPADVFRGKYVALRFEDQEGHGETGVDWASLDEVMPWSKKPPMAMPILQRFCWLHRKISII